MKEVKLNSVRVNSNTQAHEDANARMQRKDNDDQMNALSKQSTGCDFYSRLVIQSRVDFIVLKLTELVEVGLLNCWCTYLGIVSCSTPTRRLLAVLLLRESSCYPRPDGCHWVVSKQRAKIVEPRIAACCEDSSATCSPDFVADIVSVVDKDATVDGGYWSCFTLQTDRGFCDLYSHKWKVKISVTVRYKSLYFPLCSIQSCPARKTHNHKLHWIVLRNLSKLLGKQRRWGPKRAVQQKRSARLVPVDSDRDSVIVVGVRDLRRSVAQPVVTVSPENRQARFVRLVVLASTMWCWCAFGNTPACSSCFWCARSSTLW